MNRDQFMHILAAELRGPRASRERLLIELRDHIDDATAAEMAHGQPPHDAEQVALNRLGVADEILGPWHGYIARRRRETRRRMALLTITAATASTLAVAQHASGLRQPASPCTPRTTTIPGSSPTTVRPGAPFGCNRPGNATPPQNVHPGR